MRMNHSGGKKVEAVLIKVSLHHETSLQKRAKALRKEKIIVQKVRELTHSRSTRLRQ